MDLLDQEIDSVLNESIQDEPVFFLSEVRYDTKRGDAEKVRAFVKRAGLQPGDVRKYKKVKGVVGKPAFVAVNKDGVGRVYSTEDKETRGASGGKDQAYKWAESGTGTDTGPKPPEPEPDGGGTGLTTTGGGTDGTDGTDQDPGTALATRPKGEITKAKDKQLPATIKKPEEKPEEKPQIKINPDLQVGGSGVRIIGGLKSVGDAADTIILNKIKDDPIIKEKLPVDHIKRFAEVVKQFALQTISGEDLTRQLEEQEPSPAEKRATQQKIQAQLKKVVANFNKFLDDRVKPVMDAARTKKNKPGETREVKDILIDDLEALLNTLKDETKRKIKANSALVTKNYGAYQKMAPALSVAMINFMLGYMPPDTATNEQITTKEVKAMSDNEATLNEDSLVEIVINFEDLRSKQMNESFLAMFGGWVEHILKAMFGGLNIPVKVQGNDREVQAFAAALGREKRYIETAKRYGLDHPTTYKNKAKLAGAAKNFQRETGLKWPFK